MKKFILLFIIFVSVLHLDAQTIVQGTIKDVTTNEPLIGAFVTIKGTKLGAVSDLNGNFQIIAPSSSEPKKMFILVNHLGYYDGLEVMEILPIDDGETIIRNFELEPDPLTLKDVMVTANRVEEELQDVPVAATVLDAKNLEVRTVSTAEEAFEIVPNLILGGFLPGRPSISLRGLASDFTNAGIENSVGLYIDDVFQSRSFNFNNTLMDVERVEVLRGPQGTLFGKNTIGGLLHIISEKPKFGNFASVELSGGNFRFLQARGKVNAELVPNKLALRVAGAYRKRDGWMQEPNPQINDENGVDFYGGRIGLLYQPKENVEVILRGYYSEDNKADFTVDYKTPDSGFDRIPIGADEVSPDDRAVTYNETSHNFEREDFGGSANVNWDLKDGIHKVSSVTSYSDNHTIFTRDFDASLSNAALLTREADVSSFTQELRISTPRENRKFFYVGGLFFLTDKVTNRDSLALGGDMANVWKLVLQNPDLPFDETNYFEYTNINSEITSTSYAAFLNTSFEVSDRIRINAGGRYTYEEKEIQFTAEPFSPFGLMALLISAPVASKENPLLRTNSQGSFSGNIGLDFKTTDKTLLYVNFSRGFKGAGFNIGFSSEQDPDKQAFLFKPEFVNNYEFGIKLKQGNRFLFNAAAFVTDFKDKQEAVAAGTSLFVSNAKAVQGQGFEAEFTGIWNKFFKTEASIGILNLEYTDFPFPDPFNSADTINLSGNKALKAPNFTFKFSPEFHANVGKELKLLVRGDYNFVGKTYNDIYNTESLARQPRGLVNARLTVSTKDEKFAISLWGKNLTNETFYQHGWSFIFGDLVSVNPPRMIGMELRMNFY